MTALVKDSAWQPFGKGRLAPAGSLADPALASRLLAYKRHVAGVYHSLAPGEIGTALPPGRIIASEKIDGETWFLHADGDGVALLSPGGKAIGGVPLLEEALTLFAGWSGLLAGELYAAVEHGRPHVFDLASVLGGGKDAPVERLRFAAFDVLGDGERDAQRLPFGERAARLKDLLAKGKSVHHAHFEEAASPYEVIAAFERLATGGGAEGLVVHTADNRVFKIKPEITIDAAVVGFAESKDGVVEMLLALVKTDGRFQIIGRVKTGWSRAERGALSNRLRALVCESAYRKTTDHGTLYRWVRPSLVVEVKCNDLISVKSDGEPVRRMMLRFEETAGWMPLGFAPSVSMINTVFVRRREDKQAARPDVRFEQVSDLTPVAETAGVDVSTFPASLLLRREVFTKQTKAGLAVRKLVAWKTNKHEVDEAYPPYVTFFTDYSPDRKEPLKTDIRVAATEAKIHALADDWLATHIKAGWQAASVHRLAATNHQEAEEREVEGVTVTEPRRNEGGEHPVLTIAFARSTSPAFSIVRQRADALSPLGNLAVTKDGKDREAWFELSIDRGLVENARKIASLIAVIRRWKTAEVLLDGELLGRHELDDFIYRLEHVRCCFTKSKERGSQGCRQACMLGCEGLRIMPSRDYLNGYNHGRPLWFTVGDFDGQRVAVDKAALKRQVGAPRNTEVRACPYFDAEEVLAKIDALPDSLAADGQEWLTVNHLHDGKSAWVWPREARLPPSLTTQPGLVRSTDIRVVVGNMPGEGEASPSAPQVRVVPPTRYSDVQGQDAAVETVRDLVELPFKHGDLFARIGAKPKAHGIILAGPPGTGKSLLARAMAGECGAHLEIVSGPELLSKWVGETEEALRDIFERAKKLAPSVVIFDEVDCLASSREAADSQYQRSMVTQLLALLDGLEERGQVFVIGTTNRPADIDPALRRPGRFDQVVWMGLPDETGRAAIFKHYLRDLKLPADLDSALLAQALAAGTPGLTGADIAFLCQKAAMLCVKEAGALAVPPVELTVRAEHFRQAIRWHANDGWTAREPIVETAPLTAHFRR